MKEKLGFIFIDQSFPPLVCYNFITFFDIVGSSGDDKPASSTMEALKMYHVEISHSGFHYTPPSALTQQSKCTDFSITSNGSPHKVDSDTDSSKFRKSTLRFEDKKYVPYLTDTECRLIKC